MSSVKEYYCCYKCGSTAYWSPVSVSLLCYWQCSMWRHENLLLKIFSFFFSLCCCGGSKQTKHSVACSVYSVHSDCLLHHGASLPLPGLTWSAALPLSPPQAAHPHQAVLWGRAGRRGRLRSNHRGEDPLGQGKTVKRGLRHSLAPDRPIS